MARPQKNTVSYFPLDCESGKKMFYIEETYGNDGFATFIKILQELARSEYHYLDLSKKTTLMFLSSKCKVSIIVLESIINDLSEMNKFDNDLWNNDKIIWCQDFIDSIQDAYLKRKNKCIDKKGLLILLDCLGVRKLNKLHLKQGYCIENNTNNTQSILDNNKEDKTKENKIKTKFNFREKLLDYGFKENLVNDWMLIRKTKKATDTETTFNKFIREIELATEDKNELLEFIVGKEWRSFEYQWLVNLQSEFKKQQDRNNGETTKRPKQYNPSDELKEKIARRLFPDELS
jgi:hypothetical protein